MEECDYSESCRRETQLAEFMDQTADRKRGSLPIFFRPERHLHLLTIGIGSAKSDFSTANFSSSTTALFPPPAAWYSS
jgi:hypothetical protein